MLKQLSLTLFLLCSISILMAQETVSFVAYWSVGDVYTYRVTKVKQEWRSGKQTINDTSQYVADFKVLEATDTQYKISWTPKFTVLQDSFETDKVLRLLSQNISNFQVGEVIYTTTEMGEYIGIENWEELSVLYRSILDKIAEGMLAKKGSDPERLEKVMKPLINIFSSKGSIEQLVFKELQYIHYIMGLEIGTEEKIQYEEVLPNLLGGAPIKSNAYLYLHVIDHEYATCTIDQIAIIDEDDAKQLVMGLLKKMGLKDKELKKAIKNSSISIEDENKYEFVYYPCYPTSIKTKRNSIITVQGSEARKLEEVIIELIPNE